MLCVATHSTDKYILSILTWNGERFHICFFYFHWFFSEPIALSSAQPLRYSRQTVGISVAVRIVCGHSPEAIILYGFVFAAAATAASSFTYSRTNLFLQPLTISSLMHCVQLYIVNTNKNPYGFRVCVLCVLHIIH